ncbi:FKBP-type peptidyl-prolyl cis-trans isomerase [Colwellia sp. Bg11-12]|jgi:FKBP-type peptidyl-prolyl cis-trans isomerase FkpA|uniref:FKBP-type peptidyl-prolyl cis-trans isomerase n=1 Tax=Colwellia sp. Bg11-12 TaxID=2759817 RepID=UPI0015F3E0B7|nr:FKBP-type peptidyl-prolyl cis-trans isomerase [Colwellia sp. Bg11-12]MBA6263960.1 FKBP-type peptidyl-prolyl cis-trans isomerase [Colwellia sp. Bg11-12]
MKLFKPTMLAIALVSVFGCQESVEQTAPAPVLETEIQKQSYSLGASIGMYMQKNLDQHEKLGVPLDQALITRGFTDSLAGKSIIEKEEIQALLMSLDEQMKAKQAEIATAESAAAIAQGTKFLEENAKKDGVKITESGIQYVVVTESEGEKPSAADTVTVHYTGTFIDGEKFDSSYDRGKPAVLPLNRVIKGWTEGVQLMSVGSKYLFTIPSDLAYGPAGNPQNGMPGNSVLQFEIELLDIKKAAEPEEAIK